MDIINEISYYTNKIVRCYFFQEDSELVQCACNTVQLLQRCRLIQHLSEQDLSSS